MNHEYIDRSGTITAGGTAQTLMATRGNRKGFYIQNQSTGDLWINEIGGVAAATQPSLRIVAGAFYCNEFSGPALNRISIFGATTGQAFAAREW